MKRIGQFHLAAALLALAAVSISARASAGGKEKKEEGEIKLDFEISETGKLPKDFSAGLTGKGRPGVWVIQEDPKAASGKKVLAQTDADTTDYRFPVCVYDKFTGKDVEVGVKFRAVSGSVDQGAGVLLRYKDQDNYYIARANALEDNVRLYRVVKGDRQQFAGGNMKVKSGEWHELELKAVGSHFTVEYDDKVLFEADDDTFKEAGKVGLWTKADSVILFDDFTIEKAEDNGKHPAKAATKAKTIEDRDDDDDDDKNGKK